VPTRYSALLALSVTLARGVGREDAVVSHQVAAAPVVMSSVPRPFTVARDGLSLNAAVACAPHQRERVERLCRYITRRALALERLSRAPNSPKVFVHSPPAAT
jgi:hypothetical protein